MSALSSILSSLGHGVVDDAAKYGYELMPHELRSITTKAIADNVLSGNREVAANLLRSSPILTRAENIGRTVARVKPDYQNIALTTLNDAPVGFGMVNKDYGTHITALDPNLMARKGQKAFANADTAWQAPKGMEPVAAQNRFFIDEFGAKPIESSREALQRIAWDDKFLRGLQENGWGELNAPIASADVLASGSIPHSQHGYTISSRNALENNILDDISGGSTRDEVMRRINKYLPVSAGALPILGSLLGSSNQENI